MKYGSREVHFSRYFCSDRPPPVGAALRLSEPLSACRSRSPPVGAALRLSEPLSACQRPVGAALRLSEDCRKTVGAALRLTEACRSKNSVKNAPLGFHNEAMSESDGYVFCY